MKKVLFLLNLIFFTTTSCIKDVDFEQINNMNLSVPIDVPLIYFNLNQSNFLDISNNEISSISDVSIIDIDGQVLNNTFGIVTLETVNSNTFNRDFKIEFTFISHSGDDLFTKSVIVPTNADNLTQNILIQEDELILYRLFNRIRTKISMLPGMPINSTDNFNLSHKSALHFRYTYPTP